MNKHALLPVVFLLLISCSNSSPSVLTAPCPTDGRQVWVFYQEPDHPGELEHVIGSLVGWSAEWVSVKAETGALVHLPTGAIFSVDEVNPRIQ